MRIILRVLMVIILLVSMTGCIPGPNRLTDNPDESGNVAGFWRGLWHGFISLFTFLLSLFSDHIRIYEVHNNGNWYNFGFMLGMMSFFGGGSGGACRRARRH